MRPVPIAPTQYDGSLGVLFQELLEPILPSPASVIRLHHHLKAYVARPDPLFIVRNRGTDRRGEIITLPDGARIRMTDNSPAWWMHHLTYQDICFASEDAFAEAVKEAPHHFFQNTRLGTSAINRAGWYVAHLLRALPTSEQTLPADRATAAALFIRNVHPMNHFYLPHQQARLYEGRKDVLAYMAHELQRRYGPLWTEFVGLAGLNAKTEFSLLPPPDSGLLYTILPDAKPAAPPLRTPSSPGDPGNPAVDALLEAHSVQVGAPVQSPSVRYAKSRLWFMADLIEPLAWDETFQVDTDDGAFIMTKRDFYTTFPNVVESTSYQTGRNYHMKPTPRKAMRFRIA